MIKSMITSVVRHKANSRLMVVNSIYNGDCFDGISNAFAGDMECVYWDDGVHFNVYSSDEIVSMEQPRNEEFVVGDIVEL